MLSEDSSVAVGVLLNAVWCWQLEMEKLTEDKQKMEEQLHHIEEEQRKQQQEFLDEASKKSAVSGCL